jgi:hypothetical protein
MYIQLLKFLSSLNIQIINYIVEAFAIRRIINIFMGRNRDYIFDFFSFPKIQQIQLSLLFFLFQKKNHKTRFCLLIKN